MVNKVRNEVEEHVSTIGDISRLEAEAFSFISNVNQYTDLDIKKKYIELISLTENLKEKIDSDVLNYQINSNKINREQILFDLGLLKRSCQYAIAQNRKQLGLKSEQLLTYWNFTHVLLVTSCILLLLLSLLGYSVLNGRKKIQNLKKKNKAFFNTSVTTIITCDCENRINEFNNEAKRQFGYSFSEIKNKNVRILYATDREFEKVQAMMLDKGIFEGEVLNVDKAGNVFVSYLSANIIKDENGIITGSIGISRDITEQKKLENELRYVIDKATDVVYRTDISGKITHTNASVLSTLGYSELELVGLSYKQLIHPDYREEVVNYYSYSLHSNQKQVESYYEFPVVKKNGDAIWVGQNIKILFDVVDAKRPVGFFGIMRNIDARKKAEFDLLRSEEQYRELFENSSDLIHSVDVHGKILYVNHVWKDTFGYTSADLEDLNLFDIIHPESKESCLKTFNDVVIARAKKSNYRFFVLTKNEEKILLEGSLSTKIKDGQVLSIQSFMRDITKREEVAEKLRRSEANFKQIANTISDLFYLYNIKERRYEYISPNCINLIGLTSEKFYNSDSFIDEFVHPQDRPVFIANKDSFQRGIQCDIEYRIVVGNQIKWISEKSFPIKNQNGEIIQNSGICRDITNSKLANETIIIQNQEIVQSISYAKNFQDTVLPTQEEINHIFPEAFVFYLPKDVLSGDFYSVDIIRSNDKTEFQSFLVADCTGHGVPGGILNMLCNSIIKESFTQHHVNSPAQALDYVSGKLVKFFKSDENKNIKDGMDISFCVLNKSIGKLYFSGANNACNIIRNGEWLSFKGDKQHVGYNINHKPFTLHEIDVFPNDKIYLFTDGYIDQFGGHLNKKFSRKKLKEILLKIHNLSMQEQFRIVKSEFENWRGVNEQTDDVTVLGIKI